MKRVIILLALAFFFYASAVYGYVISGTVTDDNNEPLIGANVVLRKSPYGTTTDVQGEFILEDVHEGDYELVVSYVGYETYRKELEVKGNINLEVKLKQATVRGEEIIVRSTRAKENTPVTYSMILKDEIRHKNLGQDITYLLSMEPSVVSTSDAGAGIGHTALRIRGSDIQRINVTLNGIPLNDPESHGVFWVNIPDFSSSVQSIQVQRGVGTSTNGAGAFGATISVETDRLNDQPFAEFNGSAGSFNTWKTNARFGTGLMKGKWSIEGRASKISSDGYIDRSFSDLKSFFIQGGYYGKTTNAKIIVFSGKEKTYQAWNGVSEFEMEEYGRTFNSAGAIYDKEWNILGFYDNETDNYQQDHYQFHLGQDITDKLSLQLSLHYTYGRGYYEQYYSNEPLEEYPVGNLFFGRDSILREEIYEYFYHDTVTESDMIVRRWLDNDFYGSTFSLQYKNNRLETILGGAWNNYDDAKHYGEIRWSRYAGDSEIGDRFYDNVAQKSDFNTFLKVIYSLSDRFNFFTDLQYRNIAYKCEGIDKGGADIDLDKQFHFFNPKLGLNYAFNGGASAYLSYSRANREPNRNDFLDAPSGVEPVHEELDNMELGLRKYSNRFSYAINGFYMHYSNQLVLTGEINDVGSFVRENIGTSYRSGIEADASVKVNEWLTGRGNIAYSRNKTDYRRKEGEGTELYKDVDIAYSPKIVSVAELTISPVNDLRISLNGKYVGRQYLDNTGSKKKSIDPFLINNLHVRYSFDTDESGSYEFSAMLNNLFNVMYSANGYVWGETPYFYPQAGINFLAGIRVRF